MLDLVISMTVCLSISDHDLTFDLDLTPEHDLDLDIFTMIELMIDDKEAFPIAFFYHDFNSLLFSDISLMI